MEKSTGVKYCISGIVALLVITVLAVMSSGLLLEDGECYQCNDTEICSMECIEVNEESCHDLIESTVYNRTYEIEGWCQTLQNITDLINSTYGSISEGFIEKCEIWKSGNEKWKEQWEICDEELHDDKFINAKTTIEGLESDKARYEGLYRDCDDDLDLSEEQLNYAQSNLYTGGFILFLFGAFIMWFFKVRKKEANVEGQPDGYESVEGY